MLLSLLIKGFKGFKEEVKIDFSKIKEYDFNTDVIKNKIVNKGIIYGKNASGKSNIGYAIFDIVSNLTDKNNGNTLYTNYVNAENKTGKVNFEYTFKFNNSIIIYKYSKKSLEDILEEEVIVNNKKIIHYNFEKRGNIETYLKGTESLNKNFDGMKISVLKYIYKNSNIDYDNEESIAFKNLMEFVDKMLFFRCLDKNVYLGFETGSKNILESIVENKHTKEFEKFLNEEGIKCKLVEIGDSEKKNIAFKIDNRTIPFYNIASTGTNSLALFFYWYKRIDKASFVFIDEFDAFYHFELSKKIVEKLKEIKAQIILTTHNTFLMTNDLLRPDCYFIVSDNKKFEPLFEKTEKELRFEHNLEKIFRATGFES